MARSSEAKNNLAYPAADDLRLAGVRVAAVVFSSYPGDPRPRRAAEALYKEGAQVEVICLRDTDNEPKREKFNGIDITRIPLKHRRGGKFSYVLQYALFALLAGAILTVRSCRTRYHLVHIHNMPDFLVFCALVPKLLGAKVILDLHDPMPELMMTIFGLGEDSLSVRLLKFQERLSLRYADLVISVNEACKKIFAARSCNSSKISVIMNSPDADIFRYRPVATEHLCERETLEPFVIMYHGSIVERHGLDLAVTALYKIKRSIPRAQLRIYGRSTPFLEKVMDSVRRSSLRESVCYFGPKKLEQIVEAIGECSVGIIPNRRSIFTELNTPTRIFEYLSQGKPVIAPRAPGISDYFGTGELLLFRLGDADDLAETIEYVFTHPNEVRRMVQLGQLVYRAHQWHNERLHFLDLVRGLMDVPQRSTGYDEIRLAPVLKRRE